MGLDCGLVIENTRWVPFDIQFTRQGFENTCWRREASIRKAEPGKLNVKRREHGILFISTPNDSLFKLAILT